MKQIRPKRTLLSRTPLGVEFEPFAPEVREAKVWVPDSWKLPDIVNVPTLPGDLPDPHYWQSPPVVSWRRTPRSHHRVLIRENYREKENTYSLRTVGIRTQKRGFSPYVSHWYHTTDGWLLVHHFNPAKKVELWTNKKQRDIKHRDRSEPDDSRADALRLLNYKHRDFVNLRGALNHANRASWQKDRSGVLLDTALVIMARENQ